MTASLKLENELLELRVLPDLGAKISQIIDKQSGENFLHPPQRAYRTATDDDFASYDISGFDECFPNIAPEEYLGNKLADHGELWLKPAAVDVMGQSCKIVYQGQCFDYQLEKTITLLDSKVLINYQLLARQPMGYLWSAHPLLAVENDDEVLLPARECTVYYSSTSETSSFEWPLGGSVDLARVDENRQLATKLFFKETRAAALYRRRLHKTLIVKSNCDHMGVWLTYGGWPQPMPVDLRQKQLTVALEPTFCSTDSLCEAEATGEIRRLAAGKSDNWQMQLEIKEGRVEPDYASF